MEIITGGECLDLSADFSINIENTNPIFNDVGSTSIPATVPCTRRNNRILAFPGRLDSNTEPNCPERTAIVRNGAYTRRGVINITDTDASGITFNIGFDNSAVYAKWRDKKLSALSSMPIYTVADVPQEKRVRAILDELYRIYREPDSRKDDFAVFPLAVNKDMSDNSDTSVIYWEILNLTGSNGLEQPQSVKRLIDGEITEVSVPEGYMVLPFLRVWRILELIFADMNLTLLTNPFWQSLELSRLVVLNNSADSVCRGEIRYSDLMPDSTVQDFLNSLWVRFGMVYNIDFNNKTARLELIKDIIRRPGAIDIDNLISGPHKITYEAPQYVKLSAKSSIEGAAPSHERFEDFAKGLDLTQVHLGNTIKQWKNTGSPDEPVWDGDVRGDQEDDVFDPDDPDYPDPPDPWGDEPNNNENVGNTTPPDDYIHDYYDNDYSWACLSARMVPARASDEPVPSDTTFLAREFITGMWYQLDSTNGKTRLQSTSFFNWDPRPEGISALDLASNDEWVPVVMVSNGETGTGHNFVGLCPTYLFGSRHYHSYIKGSSDDKASGNSTPLAFMFAYTKIKKTFGRLTPEDSSGQRIILDDGTSPRLSLLFQFKDGLFRNFWSEYDELLRHGNRTIEVSAVFNKLEFSQMNMLNAIRFQGVRCLVDTASFSLPSGKNLNVDLKLRCIQAQGHYDITQEQGVPDFAAAPRHLEWKLKSDSFGSGLDSNSLRQLALDNYISKSGYKPHGPVGDYYYLGIAGVVLKSVDRIMPIWQTDSIPEPTTEAQRLHRKYKVRLTYSIYEIHDFTTQDSAEDWELSELPLGESAVDTEYVVALVARWVKN